MNNDKTLKSFAEKIKRRRIAALRRVRNCIRFSERPEFTKTEVKCLL